MGIGEEPVGRPRTKGWSGVGANSFILEDDEEGREEGDGQYAPFRNVGSDVFADSGGVLADDKT